MLRQVGFLLKWWAIFAVKLGSCQCTQVFFDKMSQVFYVQLASEQTAINVSLHYPRSHILTVLFVFLWNPQYVAGSWAVIVIRMLSMKSHFQWHFSSFYYMTMCWHLEKRLALLLL